MKKHVALEIMLPMILIFILTVTVNMTITSCLQNSRSIFQDISASSEVSTDIAVITNAGIMQNLSANMEEIQDYTTINDEVSNDLKKEIAKFKAI